VSVRYLDNAATTFPKPTEVSEAVADCINNWAVDPRRGSHGLAAAAGTGVEKCRAKLAEHLGVSSESLSFVPSATYGINTIMQGFKLPPDTGLYVSPYEHNAVARCAEHLRLTKNVEYRKLPIHPVELIDLEEMEAQFQSLKPGLVVVTHASNVTGDILPLKEIIKLTHKYGGRVLVDGAQTVGLYTPNHQVYNYDFLAFSSHKALFGIPGSGGLVIVGRHDDVMPLVYGGTGTESRNMAMPGTLKRFEAGTQPVPAIVSMLAGIEWIQSVGEETIKRKTAELCSMLIDGLRAFQPEVRVIGRTSPFGNIGIVSFTIMGISPQEAGMVFAAKGICVRTGLHCAPWAHESFGTLPHGTIRVSPSFFSSEADMQCLLETVGELVF
jgi:selenocysteine lyase/cysteine desulfurase